MRGLSKQPTPPILLRKGDAWRDEYAAALSAGTPPPHRWRHEQIRSALTEETSGRCAYCEGPMIAVSFGDIEHMRPRALFPELVVEWSNLTLSCARCNNEKTDKWENDLPFINPYVDRVEDHIIFVGAIAWGVSERGIFTIDQLGLNSLAKVQARDAQVKNVMRLFQLWATSDSRVRGAFADQLRQSALSEGYTASATSALRVAGFPL